MSSYCLLQNYNRKNGNKPLQAHTHFIKAFDTLSGNKRMFRTHLFKNNLGSATVEATFILPIFMFAMLFIYNMGCMLCTKVIVYEAMQETAGYLAEYSYLYNEVGNLMDADYQNNLTDTAVNIATATGKMSEYIDDRDFVNQYVVGGTSGIMVTRAELNASNKYIYFNIVYQLKVDVPFFGEFKTSIEEQIRQRAYLGERIISGESNDEYVYIAENQSVYHTTRNCYHIKLTIKMVNAMSLSVQYNNLSPCELCVKNGGSKSILYVTEAGDRYHYSRLCRGLKRTVYRVKRSECQNLAECSNCGK